MSEGEAVMIDAELVQNGGVNVVNIESVLNDRVAQRIGFAVSHAPSESASS